MNKAYSVVTSCEHKEYMHGLIYIDEYQNGCHFRIFVQGLQPYSAHGFHIHTGNDLSKGCDALGGHFNPTHKKHGDLNSGGHAGDLGNLYANQYGIVDTSLFARNLTLKPGRFNIMNRSLIIHADKDDLGLGNNRESHETGNSGKRILAGIIKNRN